MEAPDPIYCVLRFVYGKRGSPNPIVSKTMGRYAVIDHAYQGPMPQPYCFWLCRLEGEKIFTDTKGCFVVTPLKEVAREDDMSQIAKLVPGTFDVEIQGTTVFCKPKIPGLFWIAPFNIKDIYLKPREGNYNYSSVIVPVKPDLAQLGLAPPAVSVSSEPAAEAVGA
jgi:hypothetical protein